MDLPHFAYDILTALALGMLIGVERQLGQHTAGLRTNTLVCVGAALFVSAQRLLDPHSSETRIAAQVVSGIGFLGGGVILREGFNVRGMNTAATLWCSAALGTLAGMGLLIEGVIGAFVVLVANLALRPMAERIQLWSHHSVVIETLYRIRITCSGDRQVSIRKALVDEQPIISGATLQALSVQPSEHADRQVVVAEFDSMRRNDEAVNELASRFGGDPGVFGIAWEIVR